jgi:hypothetical protein
VTMIVKFWVAYIGLVCSIGELVSCYEGSSTAWKLFGSSYFRMNFPELKQLEHGANYFSLSTASS